MSLPNLLVCCAGASYRLKEPSEDGYGPSTPVGLTNQLRFNSIKLTCIQCNFRNKGPFNISLLLMSVNRNVTFESSLFTNSTRQLNPSSQRTEISEMHKTYYRILKCKLEEK